MIRRAVTSLAVAFLLGTLLAACGSSSTTTGQSISVAPASTGATGSTSTTAPSGAASAVTPQAVEACKHEIQAAPTLSEKSKSKLEAVCATAAAGNTTAVKKAVREVCEEAINKSPLPAVAKEPALASCRSRTK
jgi:NAD(P)H-hydrate repair Nnr-like enzyme with NAD(P)H-hydrate dehydratase domain